MAEAFVYSVPGLHCGHCERAVKEELGEVEGVEAVSVNLDAKLVAVHGQGLDDEQLRAAIAEAGYQAA
jgi:copper chaperone CopZ